MLPLLTLEHLVADLVIARRTGDLPRLVLLCYCELRPWARRAHECDLAEHASALFTDCPHPDRQSFLAGVDALIDEATRVQSKLQHAAAGAP